MSEVKRYDPMGYDRLSGYMQQHPEGDYVRHDDYAALEARLSEARKVLEWIAKWGYGDGGRECAEKAAEWLEKNGANQTRGRGHEQ